jgi:hypothetical protein
VSSFWSIIWHCLVEVSNESNTYTQNSPWKYSNPKTLSLLCTFCSNHPCSSVMTLIIYKTPPFISSRTRGSWLRACYQQKVYPNCWSNWLWKWQKCNFFWLCLFCWKVWTQKDTEGELVKLTGVVCLWNASSLLLSTSAVSSLRCINGSPEIWPDSESNSMSFLYQEGLDQIWPQTR